MKCKCGAKTNYGCKTCPACSMEQREARKREIVALWATGMNDRQIADKMKISPKTAQWHLLQVRRKHRLSCAQDLMRWALKNGLATLCLALSVCAQPALPTAVIPSDTFDAHLAWDKSPSVEAVGYRVYFGTNSSKLTSSILAGNTTNLVVPSLNAATVWYFAATAYDTNGFESDFSNQASLPLPAKTNVVITITMQTNNALTGWKQDIRLTPIVLTNPSQSSMFYRLTITSTNQ